MAIREEEDYKLMERLRRRVEDIVADDATAESLKPYYRFLCKRPCSNDDYLQAFNRPNVTLVDVSSSKGVERATEKGLIANGVEYELDCIIYASGFEITTEISRRYSIETIEGRDGLSLFDFWDDGYKTLHGMTTRGFPNQFYTGFTQVRHLRQHRRQLRASGRAHRLRHRRGLGPRCDHRRAQPGGPG